jgi:hypothetical protein
MSTKTDRERKEATFEAKNERAKEKRRVNALVHQLWAEGLTKPEIAQRLGIGEAKVFAHLVWLELTSRRGSNQYTRVGVEGRS